MNVEQLIEQLQKLPGHLQVTVAVKADYHSHNHVHNPSVSREDNWGWEYYVIVDAQRMNFYGNFCALQLDYKG